MFPVSPLPLTFSLSAPFNLLRLSTLPYPTLFATSAHVILVTAFSFLFSVLPEPCPFHLIQLLPWQLSLSLSPRPYPPKLWVR